MKLKLLFNYLLKQPENNKIFIVSSMLLLSVVTFGQNNNDIIETYLSDNLEKFDLVASDIVDWKVTNEVFSKQSKITNVYIQQLYKGIPIFNAVSNISIKDNKVIFSGNSFVRNISSKVNGTIPVLNAKAAIIQTAAQLKLGSISNSQLIEQNSTHKFTFSNSGISQENIPVELVYQLIEDGSLKLSWLLNVHPLDGIHWWNVRVDAKSGRILQKNDWAVNCNFNSETGKHSHASKKKLLNLKKESLSFEVDQYNVFALPVESPNHGSRITVANPQNLTASPFGWHDTNGATGAEFTITRGNNVHAQLDDDGNNGTGYSPDGGAELDFNFPLDMENKAPSTYRDASLTNLFYMSNVMHDIWYQYGFDEASGNFQVNNYEKGGAEGDEVFADGQDGSGRNNANFGTPPDGQNPRMQMFLWTDVLITVNGGDLAGTYTGSTTSFTSEPEGEGDATGAPLSENPVTADLALMDDRSSAPLEGCVSAPIFGLQGKITVIRRGNCNFTDKIESAQNSGAVGILMVNNVSGAPIGMGGTTTTINIPAVMVTQAIGEGIITALQNGETINISLSDYGLDGSFDNGIIAHEYGHGISNRLIGGASNVNCMQNNEQLGEGWSDYFGVAITMKSEDTETTSRGVGTFAANQPISGNGIRQYPYTTDMAVNPFTFNNVQDQAFEDGSVSVHGVGSIWATMLWDLQWKMINVYGFDADMYNGTGGNNKTMQLVTEGLKLTPCSSGFIGARDAILAADTALNAGANQCLIWEVFARRGLGFSASSGDANSIVDQTEGFDMPPEDVLPPSSCSALNLNNEKLKMFTVYPNPASTSISISLIDEVKNATISIFDINGRQVYAKKSDLQGIVTINTENLSTGIYILKINNNVISYSEKLIIN
jgi:extracellular elastinolytic metalloproteinase